MKKLFLFLMSIILIYSGCTITQEFTFNRNFSGTAKMTIDMGSFIDMMQSMDTSGKKTLNMKDSLGFAFKESAEKLKSAGAKNIKYGWEKGDKVMYLSYTFNDIDNLNKLMNVSDKKNASFMKNIDKKEHIYFIKKGKTLIYHGIKSKKDSLKADNSMASMKDYYKYHLIFKFARKIKNVDNLNVKISENKKEANLEASLFDILSSDYDSDITFKLK